MQCHTADIVPSAYKNGEILAIRGANRMHAEGKGTPKTFRRTLTDCVQQLRGGRMCVFASERKIYTFFSFKLSLLLKGNTIIVGVVNKVTIYFQFTEEGLRK